jgi:APA family basic amino acid/polyamine antiporter
MGGIIGSGIFRNPSVVAKIVWIPSAILGVWIAGGAVSVLGAFVIAELAARRPHDGGFYAYLRDAFHPLVAFMYGWTLLLISQSGGMAAAALTFAGYYPVLTGQHVSQPLLAFVVLAAFTIVNCLGVRQGGNLQNVFMVLKIAAIALLIAFGFLAHPTSGAAAQTPTTPDTLTLIGAMAASMVAVMFAYSGWQTASFMSGELKNPTRSLPLGLLWGVGGVIVLYLLVNVVCLRVLGVNGLMHTDAPASEVARTFMGERGAQLMAAIISLSTLGFLSNQILTSPRVYHAMAEDGLFFRWIAWVHPKTRVPIVAIALQGTVAIVITFWKGYAAILNYVIGVDFLFFALAAAAVFIFRARDRGKSIPFSVPFHPYTTGLFLVIALGIALTSYVASWQGAAVTFAVFAVAVPLYYLFVRARAASAARATGKTA